MPKKKATAEKRVVKDSARTGRFSRKAARKAAENAAAKRAGSDQASRDHAP